MRDNEGKGLTKRQNASLESVMRESEMDEHYINIKDLCAR